jgi:hypothetical protein
MQDFEGFRGAHTVPSGSPGLPRGRVSRARQWPSRSLREDVRRAHSAQVRNKPVKRPVRDTDAVDIDDWHREACCGQQGCQRCGFDPRMDVGQGTAHYVVCRPHRLPQLWQRISARQGPDEQAVGAHCQPE